MYNTNILIKTHKKVVLHISAKLTTAASGDHRDGWLKITKMSFG